MWKFITSFKRNIPLSDYSFKLKFSFDKRLAESNKILEKNPSKIPVIIERDDHSQLPDLSTNKFLIPNNLSVAQLLMILRDKLINLEPTQGIFIFIGSSEILTIPDKDSTIGKLYNKYKDRDGFLYCKITGLETYG